MGFRGGFQKYFVDDVAPDHTQESRLHVLDGMRGWAALSVVLFHFFHELFGALHPEFRGIYSHFLTNGPFAVAVFFILSGQALSISFIQKRNIGNLDRMAIKRYPRLAIPVLASCLFIYGLMELEWIWHVQAAEIVGRQDWLGSFIRFDSGFLHVLHDGLVNTFIDRSYYNFFLWTMVFEFCGSFCVFLLLYSYRLMICPVILCLLFGFIALGPLPFISCFFFGMAFSLLHTNGLLDKLRSSNLWQYAGLLLLATIIFADILFCPQHDQIDRLHILLAVVIVFIAQTSRFFCHVFSMKFSQILGKLSFPVYLMHLAVLVSVTSWMIVRLPAPPTITDALLIGGAGVAISYVGAFLFLPVEKLTSKAGNMIADLKIFKRRTAKL